MVLNGAEVTIHYKRGNAYHTQGKLEAAMADYMRVIQLTPDFAEAHYSLGLVYHTQGKLEPAIVSYTRAIELDSTYRAAYNNRGSAYYRHGELEEAIVDFTRAIELDPSHAAAYHNRGIVYHQLDKLEEAIADYNCAIELDPKDIDAYHNRAKAYYKQGKLAEAIADAKTFLAATDPSPTASKSGSVQQQRSIEQLETDMASNTPQRQDMITEKHELEMKTQPFSRKVLFIVVSLLVLLAITFFWIFSKERGFTTANIDHFLSILSPFAPYSTDVR